MDYSFRLLLHSVLYALIPEASSEVASAKLEDGLSVKLTGNGVQLCSDYVLRNGNVDQRFLKETLIRDWQFFPDDLVEINFSTGNPCSMDSSGKGHRCAFCGTKLVEMRIVIKL